jgi:serine protease AprX
VINGNEFTPPQRSKYELYSNDSNTSGHILIRTWSTLKKEDKQSLRKLNVDVKKYMSKNTYLCHYKGILGPIAELSFVQIAVEYPPEVKIERGLNEEAGGASLASESPVRVHIVLHQDADLGDIKTRVASAAEVDEKDITWEKYDLEVEVKKGKLSTIAQISDVRNIHKVRPVELASNDARETISASVEVNGTQYLGSGEIIAVADSGLDKIHHAFRGRIHDYYNIYGSEVRDRNGHGTHVSGSVLGSGSLGETLIQGVAPEAKLIAQSCMDQGVF